MPKPTVLTPVLGKKTTQNSIEVEGFRTALKTFKRAAQEVPAYKDFLHKHKIDPSKVKTFADFQQLPPVTKENYLKQYPVADLLYNKDLTNAQIISASSGSSGQPTFWFRGKQALHESIILTNDIFEQSYNTKEKTTLCIIAFAMGTWIAGTYILSAFTELANRGHKIVNITPGINKVEIIQILRRLGPSFDQVLIAGYPPFIKDVIDEALYEQIDLKKLNIKLLFAGENFSEKWRDYVLERIGKKNDLFASVSIYGTADCGIMAHETPFSVYTRRMAMKKKSLFRELFPGTTILPTLVQYLPELRFYETQDDKLLFTADNSMPLVRYQIQDQGRLLQPVEIRNALTRHGYKIDKKLLEFTEHPYIALYSRSDVAAIFYALNIYPENIKYGLEVPELEKSITGKFILRTEFDSQTQQQSLHLYIELKKDVAPHAKIQTVILESVLASLKKHNSEYNRLHQEIDYLAHPIIHLVSHGSKEFTINVKHRWTAKP